MRSKHFLVFGCLNMLLSFKQIKSHLHKYKQYIHQILMPRINTFLAMNHLINLMNNYILLCKYFSMSGLPPFL